MSNIRTSQLRELIGHVAKAVLAEMDIDTSTNAITTTPVDVGTTSDMSPVTQQRVDRERKLAAQRKVKVDQKMLKKLDNDVKSLKTTYDTTRRFTRPNLKKQIDAEKKAISLT